MTINSIIIIILVVLILICTLTAVIIYIVQARIIKQYKELSVDITSAFFIQKMFDIIGTNLSAGDKIRELNQAIIDIYHPKYSTISTFDGNQYEVKATNCEKIFIESITSLGEENDFKANATKNISKYLITFAQKTLTYKSAIERQIRSAMFSPIYYNNMYLGFWLIEDNSTNAFDHISNEELSKIKNNIGIFLENVYFQNTIEIAENTDKQTGFYNNIYLYSNTRKMLTSNETSAITLICLKNIPDINDKYNRKIGNSLLIRIANILKDIVTSESMFIRYSGIRLLLITPDSNAEVLQQIMERFLSRVKSEIEYVEDDRVKVDLQILIHTFRRQNNIEKEIQKMVSYIDGMKDVNTIKII